MRHTTAGLAPVLCLVLALPSIASAQTPAPPLTQGARGFFIEATGTILSWEREVVGERERGLGAGFAVGYALDERVALFLSVDNVAMDPAGNLANDLSGTHADLGLRLGWEPEFVRAFLFGEAAFTGRLAEFDDAVVGDEPVDLALTGVGLTLGVGAQHFFRPDVAIGGGVRVTGGPLDRASIDDQRVNAFGWEGDATSLRLRAGVTWFPGRRDPRTR